MRLPGKNRKAKPYAKPAILSSPSIQDTQSKGLMSGGSNVKSWTMLQINVECVPCFWSRRKLPAVAFYSLMKQTSGVSLGGRQWYLMRWQDSVVELEGYRCNHRVMGMWWIHQESPGTLLATSDIHVQDIDDLESHMVESSIAWEPHNVNSHRICAMPVTVEPRTQEKQPLPCFVPSENTCHYCPPPPHPPALNVSTVVTTQAVVK